MIKIENVDVYGFETAIRGMRNPKNSWEKSDSKYCGDMTCSECVYGNNTNFTCSAPDSAGYAIGKADMALMQRLYKAGTEHRKYLRQIWVGMDITAPLYWISEFDTYKIGTARNSCSFMHKGVSKPFTINDFSVTDERIYEVLNPLPDRKYELKYPYETDEYRLYEVSNGRTYRVYKNGRVVSNPYDCPDVTGRVRHFEEKECKPSISRFGYFTLNLGGRKALEKWQLHRLVAYVWNENPDGLETVDHIDGDKGNNSAENLRWCSLSENIRKGFEDGRFERLSSLHCRYTAWKNGHIVLDPLDKMRLLEDKKNGLTYKQIADKYGITTKQANSLLYNSTSENTELFTLCYTWETVIEELNRLRELYIESGDEKIFQAIRCLLPCGYNQRFTVTMNYENVMNMIKQRENHRLPEWRTFTSILRELPYVKQIMGEEK